MHVYVLIIEFAQLEAVTKDNGYTKALPLLTHTGRGGVASELSSGDNTFHSK